jgi:hypothetical protein
MLIKAGHRVVTPFEADTAGADDLLHFGILAICEEADFRKNMNYTDVVRAISNLATTQVPLAGQFYILNHWRW